MDPEISRLIQSRQRTQHPARRAHNERIDHAEACGDLPLRKKHDQKQHAQKQNQMRPVPSPAQIFCTLRRKLCIRH